VGCGHRGDQGSAVEPGRRLRGLGPTRVTASRPAFYALAPGGWRDYVTLLHPPYTLWHLSYVAIGAALAPHVEVERLVATLVAFFLAVGIGAHALDELNGHRRLRLDRVHVLACPLCRRRRVHRLRVQPRAVQGRVPLRCLVRDRLGRVSAPHGLSRDRGADWLRCATGGRLRRLSEPRPASPLDPGEDRTPARGRRRRDHGTGRRPS
jgi:hypothetical protein